MKRTALLLCALILLSVLSPALAEQPALTVQGSASVRLEADYAVFSIGVETEDADVAKAQRENAEKTASVLAALKKAGCAEKDLATGNFNIFSSYRYDTAPDGSQTASPVYHVSSTLTVTVWDPDAAGSLIDSAIAAGANQLNGLSFHSTRADEAWHQALTLACADARSRADTLCAALGLEITGIRSVTLPQSYPVSAKNYARDTAAGAAEAQTVLLPGDISVSAAVEIVYSVK